MACLAPYIKCVLRLCCVVPWLIYGYFMALIVTSFLFLHMYITFNHKTYKTATASKDITLILRRASCFLLKNLHVCGPQNNKLFPTQIMVFPFP